MLAAEGLPNMQVTSTRQGESLEIRSTMVGEPETIQVINNFMAEGPQIKLGIQYIYIYEYVRTTRGDCPGRRSSKAVPPLIGLLDIFKNIFQPTYEAPT